MSSRMDNLAHLKLPLQSILSATNNFDDKHVLVRSGYDKRYTGQLSWSGELLFINARRYNKDSDEMFWTEVLMLSSLKHQNLVSLLGFCDENGEKISITRHDDIQGSLSNYLSDATLLTWVQRLKISVGLAHALSYIHFDEPRDFSVIHRDISSISVLLNDNFEPKLSDFETSMKIEASQRHHSFHTSKVWSRDGYIDPTYEKTKSVNHKTDMYSFGIVLFELLCGRESIIANDTNKYLAAAAILFYKEKKLNEIVDWDLWKQIDSQSFGMFAEIAYDCLNDELSQRPNIYEIVPRLEKALELARENRRIHSSPNHLAHLRIPFEDIQSATNFFAKKNVIGKGGFGKIYKGQLLWSGELIDIGAERLINKEWDDEKEQQFWTEITMLSSLKHNNVVSIVGFCNEVGAETIIYKQVSRGSLYFYLSDPMLLTWVKRLEICVGVAHALRYIHYDEPRDFSVIHGKINSYTVQLNNDWEPKLSDFEHSMKIKASERHNSFHTDSAWSRKGYTDPTCLETNIVNQKSDIYSFGIVLFELLCCRNSVSVDQDNKYLAPVAIFHYREKILDGIIDPDLWKQMNPQSLNIFAETAYECLNEEQSQRPNMDQIVTRLEKALGLQLECENDEHSSVVAEVGGTSSIHGESETLVQKLLNVVPDRYLQIVASIEQYSDLDEMTLEEAIGRLKTYEERIKYKRGKQVDNQEKLMFTRHENKGKYFRGRGRGKHKFSQGRNHENFKKEEEDGENSHKNYKRDNFKKSSYDTSKLQCYKCKKIGHIAPKCPQRTKPNEQSNLVEEDLEPTLLMAILEDEEQKVSLHEEDVG
ncbi:kinase-like domain, phloem protein 2-like protein [Tanacetum coccineum]